MQKALKKSLSGKADNQFNKAVVKFVCNLVETMEKAVDTTTDTKTAKTLHIGFQNALNKFKAEKGERQ